MPGALDHDEFGGVPDTPDSTKPTWRPLTALLAAAIVAGAVGTTYLIAGDDAFKFFDFGSESCSTDAREGLLRAAALPFAPQALTVPPALQWEQVEVPVDSSLDRVSGLMTTSDGHVVVSADDGERAQLMVTSNGADWSELSIPPGVSPALVDSSDGRWVVAGPAFNNDFDHHEHWNLDVLATSTDDGVTWSDVPISPRPAALPGNRFVQTLDLMVSHDRVVLIARDQHAENSDEARGRQRLTRVYTGDLSGLGVSAEFEDEAVYGVATPEAFVLAVERNDPVGWLYLASRDGRAWDEMYSANPRSGAPLLGVGAAGDAWALIAEGPYENILTKLSCGQDPVPVSTFNLLLGGIEWNTEINLHVGPAGLIATLAVNQREPRIIWSPDGRDWHSQASRVASGVDVSMSSIQVASGTDFFLAMTRLSDEQPLWFVAEVP